MKILIICILYVNLSYVKEVIAIKKIYVVLIFLLCTAVAATGFLKLISVDKSIKKDGPKKEFTTTAVNKKSPDVRAVWLNYNELFATENDEMKYRQKMDTVFSRIANADLNVAFVQVRAFNDAFYKSDYFPPTKYICGGKANFDALKIICDVASDYDINAV